MKEDCSYWLGTSCWDGRSCGPGPTAGDEMAECCGAVIVPAAWLWGPFPWRWGDQLAVGNSALAASCSQVPTAPAQVEATSPLLEGWESCSVCFSPSSGMRVLLGTNRARRLLPFALRRSEEPASFRCNGWRY